MHCGYPQRVTWAVAQHEGKQSICPLGWKMQTSFKPPMLAISVAPLRFTHDLIAHSGEVVLAWPGGNLAEATYFCGSRSGRDTDKLAETGLTAAAGKHVKAPLISECIANLECAVRGQMTSGDHTIFAVEVLSVWLHETPARQLCAIDRADGYDFLLERGHYRFGVVRR